MGDCLLQLAPSLLSGTQKIVVSEFSEGEDEDKAFYSTCNEVKICDPTLQCNPEEADTRLWLRAIKSERHKMLVFSPDTHFWPRDGKCSNNGCSHSGRQGSIRQKFIHLNALVQALSNDVDLNPIPTENRSKVIQSLFVLSGCDFTSFLLALAK